MTSQGNPTKLPKNWIHCPRYANTLIENIFMAIKVPLDENFNRKLSEQYRFTPDSVFETAKSRNVKLGLWIDLTNTYRYYNKQLVQNQHCQYVKIWCDGFNGPPSWPDTRTFIEEVHAFLKNNPNEHVVVHCTHGFNRTGFLIVSFLVERLKYEVEDAVRMFATKRPPGIYKQNYINELFKRYSRIQNAPRAPFKPNWNV